MTKVCCKKREILKYLREGIAIGSTKNYNIGFCNYFRREKIVVKIWIEENHHHEESYKF